MVLLATIIYRYATIIIEYVHTFINDMSMQTPPLGDKVWPSIDVAPP